MNAQDLSGKRRDAGIRQVTERDVLVLTWIAEQYCISFDQLQHLLGTSAKATTKTPNKLSISATRNAVSRWLELGYIDPPRKIIAEHQPYLWLSRRGLTQLTLPYPYYQPRPASVKHIYTLNRVRLYIQTREQQVIWRAQRTFSTTTERRPFPDAELRRPHAPSTAIQVLERPLAPVTLHDELQALSILLNRYSCLWYVLHVDVQPMMQQALATFPQEQQQRVLFYDLTMQEIARLPPGEHYSH
jgi:hypothetical protein